jgi:hypothetical protein
MPSLIVVMPERGHRGKGVDAVKNALEAEARTLSWNVLPFVRTELVRHVGAESNGRGVRVLNPQDTEIIYRAAHVGPLAVIATVAYRVRRDPRIDPATQRSLLRPGDFLRYKGYVALVRAQMHAPAEVVAAGRGLQALACANKSDPRVLPMHIFAVEGCTHDLSDSSGRRTFDRQHGGARARTDPQGRLWKTGVRHGRETLVVAGTALPTGFHWDVSVPRGSSELCNGWQVWELQGRRGYANVAPDADIRRGNEQSVLRWRRGVT